MKIDVLCYFKLCKLNSDGKLEEEIFCMYYFNFYNFIVMKQYNKIYKECSF